MEAGDLVITKNSPWHGVVIGFSNTAKVLGEDVALRKGSKDVARVIWLHEPSAKVNCLPSKELVVVGNVGGHHVV
jgi:hypothetical protein